jgi:hypothetical protein
MAEGHGKRRHLFGGLLLLVVAITLLVGTSSATLILPQLDWWPLKHSWAPWAPFDCHVSWCEHLDNLAIKPGPQMGMGVRPLRYPCRISIGDNRPSVIISS